MKRTVLGALLFLILVGEPTVGFYSGLFTPAGLLVLGALYIIMFMLYEALVERYQLTNVRIVLLTFGVYSVLVTGLLHGEIANYTTEPHNNLITSLIRIQCSFFPLFAYHLINKLTERPRTLLPLRRILVISALFIIILTPSNAFGLTTLLHTFQTAPVASLLFSISGMVCIKVALRKPNQKPKPYNARSFDIICYWLLVLSLIPLLQSFLVLVVAMPIAGVAFLCNKSFRDASV